MSGPVIERLDPLGAPLQGTTLIEASAGTGKTYTITGLYLRLVLETDCRVDQILVVTYTIAATEELRDRVRRRLVEADAAFRNGGSDDTFLAELVRRAPDVDEARQRLDTALRGFDEAAIFTIHGFCQRVLGDSAFESGMPFETEIVPDPRETLQEIVDDFWRRELYEASAEFVAYVLDAGHTPETLAEFLMPYLGKPDLEILGTNPAGDSAAAEATFTKAYASVREAWPLCRSEVSQLLLEDPGLNRSRYRKTSIPGWIEELDAMLEPSEASVGRIERFKKFEKFTTTALENGVKKDKHPPEHPFFEMCEILANAHETLATQYHARLVDLQRRLFRYASEELGIRNRENRVQSFDDLLVNLLRALRAPRGEQLAAAVRGTYHAALIDEFQDTDPVQYEIFHRIYAPDPESPVFFVGDPKQAIYSFRGADIFAYLRARLDAARKYTLDVNWRSTPQLIDGVNAIFARAENPFLFDGIPYVPAEPAEREAVHLEEDGEVAAPLRIWRMPPNEEGKAHDVKDAEEVAARATAAEIARLLNLAADGRARMGDRALAGGDIAVLVRTHGQGRIVREALIHLGVPSVQHSQDDVFMTREAEELERVLMAIVEPGRELLVRAALATDLLGLSGTELHALGEDERAWVAWIERFHELHAAWRDHGFIRMFRGLMSELGIATRLLAFRDGERRLTNVLHLAELLQTSSSRRGASMDGTLQWLADRRDIRRLLAEDDDRLLRLESDENLVKIVTMHRSKGLEYPVVFCPFLWHGHIRVKSKDDFLFHRGDDLVADFGSDEQELHREQAVFEEQAENVRLLYVALTRAKARAYFVWGSIRESMRSAPAALLHPKRKLGGGPLAENEIVEDLRAVEAASAGAVRVETISFATGERYRPQGEKAPVFEPRAFDAHVPEAWRTSSFSSIAGGHAPERIDRAGPADDEIEVVDPSLTTGGPTIFTFPRGKRAGTCLHAILERIDFQGGDDEVERHVERALAEHGFDASWKPVLTERVRAVLDAPLPLPDASGTKLADVSRAERVCELEFWYPLRRMEPSGLAERLAEHGYAERDSWRAAIARLGFSPTRGVMKGFIDLVFEADGRYWIADYKSNWLGADPSSYGADAVRDAMGRASYFVQYLVYSVALHRYLQLRLPDYDYDRHFGGALYLFVRGMGFGVEGDGIFFDRPSRAAVEALDAYVADDATVAITEEGAR